MNSESPAGDISDSDSDLNSLEEVIAVQLFSRHIREL